jgi:chaperonin GroEL
MRSDRRIGFSLRWTWEGWLRRLGLEQYEPAFRENEIDEAVLPNLTAEDLKELGVAVFRKLLDARRSRSARTAWMMRPTRAAVEEGIVPGGGVALLRASEHLKGLRTKNDDQKTGVDIVRKALSMPARQIAINAGEDGSVIVGKILEKDQYAYGFDSQTGEYVNLISKGIIDPTKVVRVAIQNAASVAALLITTEAMVAELPKKNAAGGMPPGGGGGMGGMGGMDF